MRIGVISDTHNFLDPRVPELFSSVDHILHGGDIGQPAILHQLENLAPVTAVLGNTDDPGFGYRELQTVQLAGRRFLIRHIVDPKTFFDHFTSTPKPDVVVFGHTHKPLSLKIGNTLFFNPGYAGKTRFGMERSVAILDCDERHLNGQFITLK